MRFDVVTLFPDMIRTLFEHGVVGRAADSGRVRLETWNPRDYATDRHGTVDDRPYGGGPGMVMKVEPARTAIRAAREAAHPAPVVYLTPQGRPLTSGVATELAGRERLILLCGRYEGVDERLIELEVDEELSVGDYVLSGGELPAMVVMDAVSRLLPGVLGHEESAARDSFAGGLLDCPHYTRPEVVDGLRVPEILTSGDHGAVEQWRRQRALRKTWVKRPDLLEHQDLDEKEQAMIAAWSRDQND